MERDYTHISMLLDRSGSMDIIKDFIIEGFNNFIKDQVQQPGKLTVSLVQFDTDYDVLFDFVPGLDIPLLNNRLYTPRGSTALNDSWVRLIQETGITLAGYPEHRRPEKVLCICLSDGQENASVKYRGYEGSHFIKKLVEQQEKNYNWKFIYIGADQDSRHEASLRGVKNYMNFQKNAQSVGSTYSTLSTETIAYRSGADFSVKVD